MFWRLSDFGDLMAGLDHYILLIERLPDYSSITISSEWGVGGGDWGRILITPKLLTPNSLLSS